MYERHGHRSFGWAKSTIMMFDPHARSLLYRLPRIKSKIPEVGLGVWRKKVRKTDRLFDSHHVLSFSCTTADGHAVIFAAASRKSSYGRGRLRRYVTESYAMASFVSMVTDCRRLRRAVAERMASRATRLGSCSF